MKHHVDRFYSAVAVLAGDGPIKQRLISAYSDNIDSISEEEIPLPLQNDFLELRHELNREAPLNGEGAVCATVRKMSIDEASRCASRLLALYTELLKLRDAVQETLPLAADKDSSAQAFLVKSVGRA